MNHRRLFGVGIVLLIFLVNSVESLSQTSRNRRPPARPAPIRPAEIREAKELLLSQGYWTGPISGRMDEASRHALIAFQKVQGRKPTGRLNRKELEALRNASRPVSHAGGYARIEVDLKRQVLFVVEEDGTVTRVLPVSTGHGRMFVSEGWERPAITPTGRFTVDRIIYGWRTSPLGRLYYPIYIVGGIAIHGYASVPTVPASSGCIRIPMFAARELAEITPTGTMVVVHDGRPFEHFGHRTSQTAADDGANNQ